MKRYITFFERTVLESCSKSSKNLQELQMDTNISFEILENIVVQFLVDGILKMNLNGTYMIAQEMHQDAVSLLKNSYSNTVEMATIVKASIQGKQTDQSFFHLKKANLSSKDYKILNAMMDQIDLFIKENQQQQMTKNTQIIFWGANNYESIYTYLNNSY